MLEIIKEQWFLNVFASSLLFWPSGPITPPFVFGRCGLHYRWQCLTMKARTTPKSVRFATKGSRLCQRVRHQRWPHLPMKAAFPSKVWGVKGGQSVSLGLSFGIEILKFPILNPNFSDFGNIMSKIQIPKIVIPKNSKRNWNHLYISKTPHFSDIQFLIGVDLQKHLIYNRLFQRNHILRVTQIDEIL